MAIDQPVGHQAKYEFHVGRVVDRSMQMHVHWVEYLQDRIRKDIEAPKEGNDAPDFSVERLSTDGKRTGEIINLSTLFGKPLGLVFGSYT